MSSPTILSVKNLVKRFAAKKGSYVTVVDHVSFSLQQSEVLGVLGPNGAGKTTIIQILLNLLDPSAGSIEYFGKNFFDYRSEILQQVTFASSYIGLPPQLSVKENLDISAQLYSISAAERSHKIEKFLKYFGMWHLHDAQTGQLSAGQMTRVMLARAFLCSPKIVLLDEPTASLDPDIASEVRSFIIEQQKQLGVSLVVTSHNMAEVSEICSRVLVLRKGKIIADNTPANLALSVSHARVNLVTDQIHPLVSFLQRNKRKFSLEQSSVIIDCDEQEIASLLSKLAQEQILYSQITIDKPSLEDYFLAIAREKTHE